MVATITVTTSANGVRPMAVEGSAEHPDIDRPPPFRQQMQNKLLDAVGITPVLASAAVAGIVWTVVLIWIYSSRHGGPGTFAVAALSATAAGVAGMFGGFLFGVPHYNAKEIAQQATDQNKTYIPSTNLEQVADWLTKILLGAGLVQLSSLSRWCSHLIGTIAAGFVTGNGQALAEAKLFTGSLLLFNLALGFPLGYVITSLWFVEKLGRKDAA
jgi:hypothetical protein